MPKKMKLPVNYSDMPQNLTWFSDVTALMPGLTYAPAPANSVGASNRCIELTNSNAGLIMGQIAKNPGYNANLSGKILNYHGGASAFVGTTNANIVQDVVRMVDYENSTNAWRMKNQNSLPLSNMVSFICDPSNHFWDRVSRYDASLVDDLTAAAKSYKGIPGTRSISLASKVCRFFNRVCFNRDDYYAWDSVVRWTIPYYWYAYGCGFPPAMGNYKQFYNALETLRKAATNRHGHAVSRFGMDQIMWYCYKKIRG